MLGKAIAAAPLGQAGLGRLSDGWGHRHADVPVRIDAVLKILAEAAEARAAGEAALIIGRDR